MLPVYVGEVLAEKYRIERVLGEGGMGVVVAATHLELGEPVSLKFIRANKCDDQLSERMIREARAVARLRSQHVARVMDLCRLESRTPYIVMEYLEGETLAQVARKRRLSVEESTRFVLQACIGIAEAHAHGIIHRDLKLSNLFLTKGPDGAPLIKVIDFGIAKLDASPEATDLDPTITTTSVSIGTPGYMSPEQVRSSRGVDTRTDVWSIGIILYRLLSGSLPFAGTNATESIARILQDQEDPLLKRCDDIPEGLATVVHRCLAKERDHRPQTVAELAHELAPFAGPDGEALAQRVRQMLDASERLTPTPDAVADATTQEPRSLRGAAPRRAPTRHLGRLAILEMVAFFVALGIVAWAASQGLLGATKPSAASVSPTEEAIAPPTHGANPPRIEEPSLFAESAPASTESPPVSGAKPQPTSDLTHLNAVDAAREKTESNRAPTTSEQDIHLATKDRQVAKKTAKPRRSKKHSRRRKPARRSAKRPDESKAAPTTEEDLFQRRR